MTGRRAWRIGFLLVLLATVAGSLMPVGLTTLRLDGYDKQAHMAVYFLLALLAAMGWPRWRGIALVGLPLVGLALEVSQTFQPQRTFSWADALANAAGIGLAVALSAMLTRWLE